MQDLIVKLRDADCQVRFRAAEQLADLADPASVPALCVALGDGIGDVRREAERALRRIAEVHGAFEAARGLYSHRSEERQAAAVALREPGLAAVLPLCDAVRDFRREVRVAAASVLASLGPDTAPALRWALSTLWPGVDRAAAQVIDVLVEMSEREPHPAVISLLESVVGPRKKRWGAMPRSDDPEVEAAVARARTVLQRVGQGRLRSDLPIPSGGVSADRESYPALARRGAIRTRYRGRPRTGHQVGNPGHRKTEVSATTTRSLARCTGLEIRRSRTKSACADCGLPMGLR